MEASVNRQGGEDALLARPGDVLAGKYCVERVIGAGAMGIVVAAIHLHLRERVAIKLLLPETAKSDDGVARFLREARASVKIKSEHIVRVMGRGRAGVRRSVHSDGAGSADLLYGRGKVKRPIDLHLTGFP